MAVGGFESIRNFLASIGVDLSDLTSKILVSVIAFLLFLAWSKILSGVQGIYLFFQRQMGNDPYKNVYGNWFYYRNGRRTVVELTLSIKPRWFKTLPSAVFDASNYNGVLASEGEVTFSDSNMFIRVEGIRGQNNARYPFLIVLKTPHPTDRVTLGTVCGQLVVNGKAYSAPVLISRDKLDLARVEVVLEKTVVVDDDKVHVVLEKLNTSN